MGILRKNPFDKAGFVSRSLFLWLWQVGLTTFLKDIKSIGDLDPTPEQDSCAQLGDRLERKWTEEIERAREARAKQRPSLLRALWRTFGARYLLLALWAFVGEVLARPMQTVAFGWLLRDITVYTNLTQDEHASASELEEVYWQVIQNCVVMLALQACAVLAQHPHEFTTNHMGMQVRVACCNLMYKHALRLDLASFGDTTAGQMVNIIANDVSRFDTALRFIQFIIIAPMTAVLACVLLSYYYIGLYATAAGLVLMLLYLPMQTVMGKRAGALRALSSERTDERIRLINEIVAAMRVIKTHNWEDSFIKLVAAARRTEIKHIRGSMVLRAINASMFLWSCRMFQCVCLVAYVLLGNSLTAEIVFVTSSLLSNVRFLLTLLMPLGATQLAETLISCKRLREFLLLPERGDNVLQERRRKHEPNVANERARIELQAVCVDWLLVASATNGSSAKTRAERKAVPCLSNISVEAHAGQLLVVAGRVGSGKSSLLLALLGELPLASGLMRLRGRLSYAPQSAWIFAGSLRDNVLFGQPLDEARYRCVLRACCLDKDIVRMPHLDQTQIGERGHTLSGGQRARVSLARAVYRRADIYLLDDPLSAVDALVARHIFHECIGGLLADKLVVLATHQTHFVQPETLVLYLSDGRQSALGRCANDARIRELLAQQKHLSDTVDDLQPNSESVATKSSLMMSSRCSDDNDTATALHQRQQQVSAQANVTMRTYWYYITANRAWCLLVFTFITNILCQVCLTASSFWLTFWTDTEQRKAAHNGTMDYEPQSITDTLTLDMNMYIYGVWLVTLLITTASRTVGIYLLCVKSARNMHANLFESIVYAPIRFFDSNPVGLILNRVSRDMGIVDDLLPVCLFDTIMIGMVLLGVFFTVIVLNYTNAIYVVILTGIAALVRWKYVRTVRTIKTIENITCSPIYSHLSSSLEGLTTIRAFQNQPEFRERFVRFQDEHSAAWFAFISISRFISLSIDWAFLAFTIAIATQFMYTLGSVTSAGIGLALETANQLAGSFPWGIRQSIDMESHMTSVLRIKEFSEIEPEESRCKRDNSSATKQAEQQTSAANVWPSRGEIEFRHVSLCYSPNAPAVLIDLTFCIRAGEKVGVVGRTGAGKSSLVSALLRLVNPLGTITIDGVNTKHISLGQLRRAISIIPQEPTLFSGTVRRNLDPTDAHTDAELWRALEQVGLARLVRAMHPNDLSAKIAEAGANLSVGERQLLCLARAVLMRNKIIVLDEATANVDSSTDEQIQRAINETFASCTRLTIAHRLNTIMDSDRVLVMDAGRVREYDEPHLLLERAGGSMFATLVDNTGQHALKLRELARDHYMRRRLAKFDIPEGH